MVSAVISLSSPPFPLRSSQGETQKPYNGRELHLIHHNPKLFLFRDSENDVGKCMQRRTPKARAWTPRGLRDRRRGGLFTTCRARRTTTWRRCLTGRVAPAGHPPTITIIAHRSTIPESPPRPASPVPSRIPSPSPATSTSASQTTAVKSTAKMMKTTRKWTIVIEVRLATSGSTYASFSSSCSCSLPSL